MLIENEKRKETGEEMPHDARITIKTSSTKHRHRSTDIKSNTSNRAGSIISRGDRSDNGSSRLSNMNPYPKLLEKHNMKATEERLADVRETIH
jgi:hypothetical protein